jgi:hypothetical protein
LTETSTQAQFLIPLIASIAFGLISATMLASIVVPCVLLILDDLKLTRLYQEEPDMAQLWKDGDQ